MNLVRCEKCVNKFFLVLNAFFAISTGRDLRARGANRGEVSAKGKLRMGGDLRRAPEMLGKT
jgi:hypothetical protein